MPPFQKGHKKVGGNVKGSKHKSTEIRDFVKDEPIEKVIELLENGQIKDTDKAKIWMEVCKYFYKTPKDQIDLKLSGGLEVQKVFIDEKTKKNTDAHIDEFIDDGN